MPTSLLGLLLFVVLLAPGFCYLLSQERRQPGHAVSVFRETVTLTITSLACDLTVAAAFAVLRIRFPRVTPDVGQLVRDPADYARAHTRRSAGGAPGCLPPPACSVYCSSAST